MRQAKYIVTESDLGENIYIFPDWIGHDEMAGKICEGSERPIRAGFVGKNRLTGLFTHGRSVSLGLSSNPEKDNKLLAMLGLISYNSEGAY